MTFVPLPRCRESIGSGQNIRDVVIPTESARVVAPHISIELLNVLMVRVSNQKHFVQLAALAAEVASEMEANK